LKAHRLLYHPTLGSKVIHQKRELAGTAVSVEDAADRVVLDQDGHGQVMRCHVFLM
jgi:hypothetical protein